METFFSSHNNHPRGSQGGFTLIELLVSMSLFAIVAVFAVGSILTTGDLARTVQAKRTVIDSVHFAIETMSRKIKVGRNYHCDVTTGAYDAPAACLNGASSFGFLSFDQKTHVEYRLFLVPGVGGRIETQTCDIATTCPPPPLGNWTSLTDEKEVNITKLTFITTDDVTPPADARQPFVIMVLEGTVTVKGQPTTFRIQTYLTQRVLES